MQADLILFLRNGIHQTDSYTRWFPDTLLYVGHFHSAFEVFARSSSKSYFEKSKYVLGIDKLSDLNELMNAYNTGRKKLPTWQFESFSPSVLLGFERLAQKV